jgi:AP-2 complex subunit alpha
MALAQDHLDAFAVCYTKAVDRLHRVCSGSIVVQKLLTMLKLVIDREYAATYAYYKVPSPWLQVKLLRLLQYYPPSGLPIPLSAKPTSLTIYIPQRIRVFGQLYIKFYRQS